MNEKELQSIKARVQPRDANGRFIKGSTGISYSAGSSSQSSNNNPTPISQNLHHSKKDPPLLSLRVTNPVTYLKSWWKKVIGNEGLDVHLKIKPLTAIAIAAALGIFGFGVGRVSVPADSPIVKYIPQLAPVPSVNPWRETAFTGTLRSTNGNVYLFTTESEALSLNVPSNLDLTAYIGKMVLAKGLYNEGRRLLVIAKAEDIELLNTKPQKIPTLIPSPTPTQFPASTSYPTVTPEEISPNPIYSPSM